MAFACDQYTLAIDQFTKVLTLDPSHVVAANNKALCYLYAGDVSKAIDILEEILFSDPSTTLQENIVYNLCTMYDLATDKSFDKRKKILQLVRTHAPDNFNLSSLKLPERAQ
jgi:trafficking protein particle complex subunit 12